MLTWYVIQFDKSLKDKLVYIRTEPKIREGNRINNCDMLLALKYLAAWNFTPPVGFPFPGYKKGGLKGAEKPDCREKKKKEKEAEPAKWP